MKTTSNVRAAARSVDNAEPFNGAYGRLIEGLSNTRVLLDVHARERLMRLVVELQNQMEKKEASRS
ncbi:hypothetical protein [Undibacter mobilis]|nr:hypothetical protein [Undibacter mobilis]